MKEREKVIKEVVKQIQAYREQNFPMDEKTAKSQFDIAALMVLRHLEQRLSSL